MRLVLMATINPYKTTLQALHDAVRQPCMLQPIHITTFTNIPSLNRLLCMKTGCSCMQVTEQLLEQLQGHTQLQTLQLGFTRIQSAGLRYLTALTSLRTLGFCAEEITSSSLTVSVADVFHHETHCAPACLLICIALLQP